MTDTEPEKHKEIVHGIDITCSVCNRQLALMYITKGDNELMDITEVKEGKKLDAIDGLASILNSMHLKNICYDCYAERNMKRVDEQR